MALFIFQITKKRKLDNLVSAETLDGGKLRAAAVAKRDERILIQIQDKNCVALEVKYHRLCYKRYTSCLQLKDTKSTNELYQTSYEAFCDYVKEHLIVGHNICYMKQLKSVFVSTVSEMQGLDASGYKACRLKEKLKTTFPQLVFFTPTVRNKSEIVYVEEISTGSAIEGQLTLLEKIQSETELELSEESGSESETEDFFKKDENEGRSKGRKFQVDHSDLRHMYSTGIIIGNIIKECQKLDMPWPPMSTDLCLENVKDMVPPVLFNFISWILGFSDEPQINEYVQIDENLALKVLALCQDLIYVAHKGKIQTPKSLALAMAVRQISGCGDIVKILNGFGHSVSYSATMAYDTSLAKLSIANQSEGFVPLGIVPDQFFCLVFDNVDFGEESKKQTHVTNGIIIQKEFPEIEIVHKRQPFSKGERSLKAPEEVISPYKMDVKVTPCFKDLVKDLDSSRAENAKHLQRCHLLDLAYVLIRLPIIETNDLLPSWTGFNTILSNDRIPKKSKVLYLPVIDASPTEYSTVNRILERSLEISDKLNSKYSMLVFDEAIYAKIQQIRWKEGQFYSRFIIRMGAFHTIMSYCGAISKLFRDSGLQVCSRFILNFNDIYIFFLGIISQHHIFHKLSVKSGCNQTL